MKRNTHLTRRAKSFWYAGPVLAYAGLTLVPLAGVGCNHQATGAPEETKSVLVEVGTTNPRRKDLTRAILQPGYLRPYEQTPIYTKIAGFAKEPRFDIGDYVKEGELLVELYVPEVVQDLRVKAAKIEQARADLKQAKEAALAAKAGVESARADVDARMASIKSAEAQVQRWQAEDVRSRKLVKNGVYDQQTADEVINQLRSSEAMRDETKAKYASAQATVVKVSAYYNKSEADVDVAVASLAVAQATHDQWRDWLAYAQITAPFDGVITRRNVHSGHFLQPSNSGSTSKAAEPLFVVMRTDIMRCTVEVPELDALLIKKGDKAEIHFQALPGAPTIGEVTRTSDALDEHTRTLRVELHLKNPNGLLRPNMYAHVSILAKLPNAWTLPEETVLSDILADGDRSYCFVVDEGKARKVFLDVGVRCDEGVQILRKQRAGSTAWADVTGKEAVVLTNNKALQDGQEVRMQAPETH